MTITEVKTEFVLATLGKGNKVTACDFSNNNMVNCGEVTVNSILYFIEKGTVKFFTVVNDEQA